MEQAIVRASHVVERHSLSLRRLARQGRLLSSHLAIGFEQLRELDVSSARDEACALDSAVRLFVDYWRLSVTITDRVGARADCYRCNASNRGTSTQSTVNDASLMYGSHVFLLIFFFFFSSTRN